MSKHKRSSVVPAHRLVTFAKRVSKKFTDDHVTLFAAQGAFFTVVAAIPFLMLMIGVSRLVFRDVVDAAFRELETIIPAKASSLLAAVYAEISEKSGVVILSFSALAMFWSSSRGVAAVTRGVAGVYGTREHTSFVSEMLRSFIHTIFFILIIISMLLLLLFGATVRSLAVARFPNTESVFDLILRFRGVGLFVILTLFFSAVYNAVSRNGIKSGVDPREVPYGFAAQLPGATVAALGWMLYSFFYSLYIGYFPNASYIYGSLAAVIFLMLWLYFCMVIFLVGAEINKWISARKK